MNAKTGRLGSPDSKDHTNKMPAGMQIRGDAFISGDCLPPPPFSLDISEQHTDEGCSTAPFVLPGTCCFVASSTSFFPLVLRLLETHQDAIITKETRQGPPWRGAIC